MNERIDPPGAESAGGKPGDAGLSVDEKFAKLAAEIDGSQVQGKGAKEEAARTRQLRAEWSQNPPKATPWRSDEPAKPISLPAYPYPEQPSKRKRAGSSAKVLVGLALVGLIGYGFWPRSHAPVPINASPAGTAAPWTQSAAATASPSPAQTFTNPDDNYFVGSPALEWADNEAGFSIPAAHALNGVSESDIAAGYKELEELMAAGNLDATILDGGSVTDFTKLLDPASEAPAQLKSWIAHPTATDDPTLFVTRFNPATTRLLGHTVKVRGSMSAKADDRDHSVLLTADYIFVYAVGPASGGSGSNQRVSMHRSVAIQVVNPDYYQMVAGKAWITGYTYNVAGITCYQYDGFVDPDFSGNPGAPNASGTIDPYATGNLLTASPDSTSTGTVCQSTGSL